MAKDKKAISDKALDAALETMRKSFGDGVLKKGSDLELVSTFRTGHDELDSVLSKGAFGVARGKIIEFSGPESSGKSSLALRVCGYAQKEGYIPFWIDLERALVKGGIAEVNGVDMEHIYMPDLAQTNVTEVEEGSEETAPFDAGKVMDMMVAAILTGKFNPVVLDTVAALVTEREMNAVTLSKEHIAEQARLLGRALRKINQVAADHGVCAIFINQERDKIDPSGRGGIITPGGRALKFYASQRLRISKISGKEGEIKRLTDDGKQVKSGHWARVKIIKNRCAPPYDDPIEIPIYYEPHFPDEVERIYEAARTLQVIASRNNVITWKSEISGDIVFKVDGTAAALNKIREENLLSKLAADCVIAEKDDKNTKKKNPYRLPITLAKLAEEQSVSEPSV